MNEWTVERGLLVVMALLMVAMACVVAMVPAEGTLCLGGSCYETVINAPQATLGPTPTSTPAGEVTP